MPPPSPRVRYVVFTWIPEDRLRDWNEWHDSVHVPHVMEAPQMRSVRKRRVVEGGFPGEWTPQYATEFTLDSVEAFREYVAGPGPALRREYEERYGGIGRIARLLLVEDDAAPARGDA